MPQVNDSPLLFIRQVGFVSGHVCFYARRFSTKEKGLVPTRHPKKGRATERETDPAAPSGNARSFQVPVWPLAAELQINQLSF